MLSSYYFLGLGNDTEGYTLLSGDGVNVAYIFPDGGSIYTNKLTLTVNQFVDKQFYQRIYITLPNETSGVLHFVDQWSQDINVDVNAMLNSYNKYEGKENFAITDIFVLSSSFNLYKTSNKLLSKYCYLNYIPEVQFFYSRNNYRNTYGSNIERLLVPQNLIDLYLVESYSQNVYEYLDQYNVSLNNALSAGNFRTWYGETIRMPISNYGSTLPTSSQIYVYEISQTSSPFFGLSSTIKSFTTDYFSEDVYVANNNLTFTPTMTGLNLFEQYFDNFTMKENKYVLSGNTNKFADLYKNEGNYFPINYYNYSISNVYGFYVSKLGLFEIISGNYINKMNEYYNATNGNLYHFGDWALGLQYIPDDRTTLSCQNFTIQTLPSSQFNYYPDLIGVRKLTINSNNYYKSETILKSIHRVESRRRFYIAIDPQTYVIAV